MAKALFEKFERDIEVDDKVVGHGTSYMFSGKKPDWAMKEDEKKVEQEAEAKAKKKRRIVGVGILAGVAALFGGAKFLQARKNSSEGALTADDQKYLEETDDASDLDAESDAEVVNAD